MVNTARYYEMKQLHRTLSLGGFATRHKKLMIFSSILGVLLIAAVAYAWWSIAVWTGIDKNYVVVQTETHRQVDSAIALPARTSEEKAKKRAALEAVHDFNSKHQTICDVPGSLSWQDRFDTVKKTQNECKAVLAKLVAVDHSLMVVNGYLHDEKMFAELVAVAGSGLGDLDEATWNETATKWHSLAMKTKDLKTSKAFDAILQRSITGTAHLDSCWQEVLAANTAKDRTRFQIAKDELSSTYGTFKDITQLSNDTFNALQKELQLDYIALAH